MIQVLISDLVKRYFLDQPPKVRARIRDKFEYLENGIWDTGLKVKKLKGVSSKVVLEARLDKANRILFSLGKDAVDGVDALLVYVWGIVVHDDISAKSRSILPAEVPFLRFKNYQEELYDELDFRKLPAAYFTQEKMSDQIPEDSATLRWHQVDDPEWKRILRYARDDFELFLFLSPQQKQILKTAPPLLISGTAGSGKTTMAVYYLLKKGLQKQSKLFLTYNPHLRDFSKRLYDGLLNEREDASSWLEPDFRTFKDLCLEIARKYHREFPPAKEMDYATFDDVFSAHPYYKKFDAELVWEEIRSIIKGGMTQVNLSVLQKAAAELEKGELKPDLIRKLQTQFLNFAKLESTARIEKFTTKYLQTDLTSFAKHLDGHIADRPDRVRQILENTLKILSKHRKITGQKHLSLFEYEMHGKKKAPNFQFNRKEIYQIFEWYENKLKTSGLWDELDLVRDVTNIISERDWSEHQYDLVVCDEIQDLTDIQQDLPFYLVKNPNNLLFAGDTKQIINPSGFRWEEIKRHYFERGLQVPELHFLTLNFRSSGSIVDLANKLLDLKQEFLGVRSGESKEEWKYKGRPAVVVTDVSEAAMIESVRQAGARRTILVRTEQERDRLKNRLETELVFTIGEAKGLEFDTVLLWKFASDAQSRDVWEVIVEASTRKVHEAKIRHEINLLYVAITRARRELIIFDGDQPSTLWRNEQIADKMFVTSDCGYIDGIWNVISTPEEWLEQGIYFFERKYYKAAMECFKNAGDRRRLTEASAHHFEKERNYLKAARSYRSIDAWESAAENYELSGRFSDALELWMKLRKKERALRCRLEVLKKQGKHEEVARIYESAGDYSSAREYYERGRNHAKVAELCEKHLNAPEEAAHHHEKARQYLQAAKLYHKLKLFDRAAPLYFKLGDYKRAESLWKRLADKPNLIRLYEKTNRLEKLLEIYEKEQDFKKSVKTLQSMKEINPLEEADLYFGKRKYFPAWVRYFVAGDNRGIARSCYKLRNYGDSARYFALAGDPYAAGDAYYKAGDAITALECFLESEEDRRADYKSAKKVTRVIEFPKIHDIARRQFKAGEYTKAAVLFERSKDPVEQGLCYAILGEKGKAFNVWKKTDTLEGVEWIARVCHREGLHSVAAEMVLHHHEFRRTGGWYSPEWRFTETSYPYIFTTVERYLDESNDKEAMAIWAEKLNEAAFEGENHRRIMKYYEKAGRYSDCYSRGQYLSGDTKTNVLRELEEEIPELERKGDLESLALRYALLGRKDDLNQVVSKLEMTENNVRLLEESDHYMKAIDYYFDTGDTLRARLFFSGRNRMDEFARILEQRGIFGEAAGIYEFTGDRESAIRCYRELGDDEKVGDMYFKSKEYLKAMEAYQKQPWIDQKKIARTHEKMADWENALSIYREVGDAKGCKRCKSKLDRIKANPATPPLPFEQA